MDFIIQKDMPGNGSPDIDTDTLFLKDILNRRGNIIDKYEEMTYQDIQNADKDIIARKIPVGSIQFVEKWLQRCHGIERINPIEVPKILRGGRFVKRQYRIVPFEEVPRKGRYFIKDVSVLKKFSYTGDVSELFNGMYTNALDPTHIYQVSEIVNIESEYRVYIIDGNIEAICNYNGSPMVFPDAGVIYEANYIYMMKRDYPRSLTMDVMVSDKGTEIIEIHPFVSVGLYSTLWGGNLPWAYKQGIDYVLKHNTLLER